MKNILSQKAFIVCIIKHLRFSHLILIYDVPWRFVNFGVSKKNPETLVSKSAITPYWLKNFSFCLFYLFYYLCRPMHFEELYLFANTTTGRQHTGEKHFTVIY